MKQTMIILVAGLLLLGWSAEDCAAQTPSPGSKAIGVAEAVRELPASIKTPNRYALVIGTGQYEDERIPALPASLNDARRLYEVLIDPAIGMFPPENVTLLVDEAVTRLKVVSALDSLGRRAGKEDLVIVFFSGHGAVDDRGRPYWVMQNTQIDSLRASALSETEITELLDEIRTTRLVTLIDACYSASTAEIGRSKSLVDIQKIYPKFKGEGRVIITGSKGDQLSVVISDKNHPGYGYSAFTWHVIEGMKGGGDADRDGVVTLDELWDYVKDRTETTARQQGGNQQPQLQGNKGSKFLLTVDGERLVTNSQQFRRLIGNLKQLFLGNKLTPEQYRDAEALLTSKAESLDQMQRERRQVYTDLASGKLDPRYLQAALNDIARSIPLAIAPEGSGGKLSRERSEVSGSQLLEAQKEPQSSAVEDSSEGMSPRQSETRVTAQVDTGKEIYVGDNFAFYIIISGSDEAGQVDLEPLREYNPRSTGNRKQTSTTAVSGKVTKVTTMIMTHLLTVNQTGRVQLPSVTVEVDGKTYHTKPVTVNVIKPGTTDRLGMEMTLSDQQCFVGQPVLLTIRFYCPPDARNARFNVPVLKSDAFDFKNPDVGSEEAEEYDLGMGATVLASEHKVMHKNKQSNMIQMRKTLIPKTVGKIQIESATVSIDVAVEQIETPFGSRARYKRFMATSDPLELTVLPQRDSVMTNSIGTKLLHIATEPYVAEKDMLSGATRWGMRIVYRDFHVQLGDRVVPVPILALQYGGPVQTVDTNSELVGVGVRAKAVAGRLRLSWGSLDSGASLGVRAGNESKVGLGGVGGQPGKNAEIYIVGARHKSPLRVMTIYPEDSASVPRANNPRELADYFKDLIQAHYLLFWQRSTDITEYEELELDSTQDGKSFKEIMIQALDIMHSRGLKAITDEVLQEALSRISVDQRQRLVRMTFICPVDWRYR